VGLAAEPDPLGPGVAVLAPPRASISDADPGAMFDSAGSKRSTAKRFGALGSAGSAVGPGVGEPAADGAGEAVAGGELDDPALGVAVGAGVGVASG
jgi:hypothetical protein